MLRELFTDRTSRSAEKWLMKRSSKLALPPVYEEDEIRSIASAERKLINRRQMLVLLAGAAAVVATGDSTSTVSAARENTDAPHIPTENLPDFNPEWRRM